MMISVNYYKYIIMFILQEKSFNKMEFKHNNVKMNDLFYFQLKICFDYFLNKTG